MSLPGSPTHGVTALRRVDDTWPSFRPKRLALDIIARNQRPQISIEPIPSIPRPLQMSPSTPAVTSDYAPAVES